VAAATSTRNVSLGVHRLGLEAELSDPERSGRMERAGLSKDHCWRWGESMGAVGAAMVRVGVVAMDCIVCVCGQRVQAHKGRGRGSRSWVGVRDDYLWWNGGALAGRC
jgi:hypothetical protein